MGFAPGRSYKLIDSLTHESEAMILASKDTHALARPEKRSEKATHGLYKRFGQCNVTIQTTFED
jgi:hypothetical protein